MEASCRCEWNNSRSRVFLHEGNCDNASHRSYGSNDESGGGDSGTARDSVVPRGESMRTTDHLWLALAATMLLLTTCVGADEPLIADFDFEQDELPPAWTTSAAEGALAVTRERANVRSGKGALEFSWEATEGRLAIVNVMPVTIEGRPRSLRLSVKLSGPSPVMYGVREADGSCYQGYLYSPGGVWHDVAVDLDELMLSEGSEDENGRLDVRQINGIMIADLSNLPGEAGQSLGVKSGRQQMWLDDVALSDALAPHRSSRGPDGEAIIDDFERQPLLALPIGNPTLTYTSGPGDGDSSALRIEYDRESYRWAGFVAAVGYLDLTNHTAICLRLRAEQAAPLTVVLEERDGSKYDARHRLDPAQGWHILRLPFEKFKLDPQTTDENSKLDLDQLRVIIPVLDTKRAELDDTGLGAWELSRIWAE